MGEGSESSEPQDELQNQQAKLEIVERPAFLIRWVSSSGEKIIISSI